MSAHESRSKSTNRKTWIALGAVGLCAIMCSICTLLAITGRLLAPALAERTSGLWRRQSVAPAPETLLVTVDALPDGWRQQPDALGPEFDEWFGGDVETVSQEFLGPDTGALFPSTLIQVVGQYGTNRQAALHFRLLDKSEAQRVAPLVGLEKRLAKGLCAEEYMLGTFTATSESGRQAAAVRFAARYGSHVSLVVLMADMEDINVVMAESLIRAADDAFRHVVE